MPWILISAIANLCRRAGFFLQGSVEIVALNLEESYRLLHFFHHIDISEISHQL